MATDLPLHGECEAEEDQGCVGWIEEAVVSIEDKETTEIDRLPDKEVGVQ